MLPGLRCYLILALFLSGCNSTEKKTAAQTPAPISIPEPTPTPTPEPPIATPTPTPVPGDDDDDDDLCDDDDDDDDGYGVLKDCECPAWAPYKSGKGKCGTEEED